MGRGEISFNRDEGGNRDEGISLKGGWGSFAVELKVLVGEHTGHDVAIGVNDAVLAVMGTLLPTFVPGRAKGG